MNYRSYGKIIKGVGGLYYVKLSDNIKDTQGDISEDDDGYEYRQNCGGKIVECRARGVFRHNHITPLVGDNVEIVYNDSSFTEKDGETVFALGGRNIMISEILPRKNSLIRPPVANIDTIFVTMASAAPEPMTDMVDKLISILEFNNIEPVVVIGKCELRRERAEELRKIYDLAGYRVFVLSCKTGEGIEEIKEFVSQELCGKTSAFAGASGVGKSSLMNKLFPSLSLLTSDISYKIERGKNTTRHVELYPVSENSDGYIADTPGFSMLDFERFDFFTKEDLPETMREFRDYIGRCRYTKCSHTKEEGCAILEAVDEGNIAKSRHESFIQMYDVLKNKKDWKK